jgi:hypothetical protein
MTPGCQYYFTVIIDAFRDAPAISEINARRPDIDSILLMLSHLHGPLSLSLSFDDARERLSIRFKDGRITRTVIWSLQFTSDGRRLGAPMYATLPPDIMGRVTHVVASYPAFAVSLIGHSSDLFRLCKTLHIQLAGERIASDILGLLSAILEGQPGPDIVVELLEDIPGVSAKIDSMLTDDFFRHRASREKRLWRMQGFDGLSEAFLSRLAPFFNVTLE